MLRAVAAVEPRAHNDPDRPGSRNPSAGDRRELTDADPDPVLSGADAVEKTTYAANVHGAGVDHRDARDVPVTASVPSGGGASPIAWIAGILALLALAAYAIGLFT